MKTIKEISVECGIERTTLNKAIGRKAFPARQSGATWIIDTESDEYKQWLEAHWKHHRTKREEQEMNNQTINSTVRYQGKLIGNVTIHPTGDTTGTAIMGGRTRKVVYRQATQGSRKGTMLWHCDDVD